MKKIIPFLLIVILIASCKSSSKQLSSGNYDAAIKKSAKKISKNPGKYEEVDTFNDAYRLAYDRDNTEVDRLKQEGNPANWGKIYNLYMKMKKHQDLAASLPPVGINYEERDFSGEITTAKNNATEYAYAKGEEHLATNNRFEARKAYSRFKEAQKYNSNYKDVNEKVAISQKAGKTNVYFRIEDNAEVTVPNALMQEIQNININDIDKNWTNYDSYIDTTVLYHYSVILNLKLIDVSPELLNKENVTESREVEDGFDYALDANGNVAKDTLGNDIKIPRYKTITCKLSRFDQKKTARISGDMEYYDNATDKLLKKEPITSEALFGNHYILAFGNLEALKPETRKELDVTKPMPFPNDNDMIFQAGEVIKKMTKDILVQNKSFLK
jgi:hypothetical protein